MAAGRFCASLLLLLCSTFRSVLARTVQARAGLSTHRTLSTLRFSQSDGPIQQVVSLLGEMRKSAEDEAKADANEYDKKMCWCKTNSEQKEEAIASATENIDSLTTDLEGASGKSATLETEVKSLEADIAEAEETLSTMAANANADKETFLAAEADMKQTIDLLTEAISVLSKVQLVQTGRFLDKAAMDTAFVQVHHLVKRARYVKFTKLMQRDLYNLLGAMQEDRHGDMSSFSQVVQPNSLVGGVAGAKSYNSRSGQVLGMLTAMKDHVVKDLKEARAAHGESVAQGNKLSLVKTQELGVAREQKNSKTLRLAELTGQIATDKSDKAGLEEKKTDDEGFLSDLTKSCKEADEEYSARVKVRTDELTAISEAQAVLTEDDTRTLLSKTISFMQVRAAKKTLHTISARKWIADEVTDRLVSAARRHRSHKLALLAERVKLDAFTKVKEAMDGMLAELKKEQKEEYDKKETCAASIDRTKDEIAAAEDEQADLNVKATSLENTLKQANTDITNLEVQVSDMQVALKQAGESRKEENQFFQQSLSDQRATVTILKKALGRLKAFYTHSAKVELLQSYNRVPVESRGGPVLQLLAKIIQDAEVEEQDLVMSEKSAQKAYVALVNEAGVGIEANNDLILKKKEQAARTEAQKSDNHQAISSNGERLEQLDQLLAARHASCDWLLKYFDVRQKSRSEEMDSIADAKAILSGAKLNEDSS